MARVLGYGGLANTQGARSFAGKTPAPAGPDEHFVAEGGPLQYRMLPFAQGGRGRLKGTKASLIAKLAREKVA